MPACTRWRLAGVAISASDAINAESAGRTRMARSGVADQLADLCELLHQIERLAQVAIGERAQLDGAAGLIAVVVDRAHQEDRCRLAVRTTLDLAKQLEAVLARQ